MKQFLSLMAWVLGATRVLAQDTNINGTINFLTKVQNADPALAIHARFWEWHVPDGPMLITR